MTVAVGNVSLHDDETMLGFASRLAASFGMPLRRFLDYKGIDYRVLRQSDPVEIEKLARQWSLDVAILKERTWVRQGKWSWYGVPANEYKGMEWIAPKYCPVCVAADIADGEGPETARPYQRLAWLSPYVSVCCSHRTFLRRTPDPDAR
jgi:hypothetical protein